MNIITITGNTQIANVSLRVLATEQSKRILTGDEFASLLRLIELEAAHISLDLHTYVLDVEPKLYKRIQALAKTHGSEYTIFVVPRG